LDPNYKVLFKVDFDHMLDQFPKYKSKFKQLAEYRQTHVGRTEVGNTDTELKDTTATALGKRKTSTDLRKTFERVQGAVKCAVSLRGSRSSHGGVEDEVSYEAADVPSALRRDSGAGSASEMRGNSSISGNLLAPRGLQLGLKMQDFSKADRARSSSITKRSPGISERRLSARRPSEQQGTSE
jgi:hypothetical protein